MGTLNMACKLVLIAGAIILQAASADDFVLRYFGVRGLAEPARLLLNDVGATYEEVRYARDPVPEGMVDWNVAKQKGIESQLFPFGQVPSLTHRGADSSVLTNLVQSKAIVNYLGRHFGLYGSNNVEASQIDVVIGGVEDLKRKWWQPHCRSIWERTCLPGLAIWRS